MIEFDSEFQPKASDFPTELFHDKASLLVAVERDGWALKFASLELRADKDA